MGTLELALGFGTLHCTQSMGTDQSQDIRVVSSAENSPRGCGWSPWVEEEDIPWAQGIAWAGPVSPSQSWGGVWGLSGALMVSSMALGRAAWIWGLQSGFGVSGVDWGSIVLGFPACIWDSSMFSGFPTRLC